MVFARAARPYTVLRLHPFNGKSGRCASQTPSSVFCLKYSWVGFIAARTKIRERVVSPTDWDEVPTFLKLKKVLKRRKGQIS